MIKYSILLGALVLFFLVSCADSHSVQTKSGEIKLRPGDHVQFDGMLFVWCDESSYSFTSGSSGFPTRHMFLSKDSVALWAEIPTYASAFYSAKMEVNFLQRTIYIRDGKSIYKAEDCYYHATSDNEIISTNRTEAVYTYRDSIRESRVSADSSTPNMRPAMHLYKVSLDLIYLEEHIYSDCKGNKIAVPQYVFSYNPSHDNFHYLYSINYPYFDGLPCVVN